ncbi:hypothetical protein [Aeromicrobium sp.]|uniref:hypothetical protein n=1 Tax=Aeromicrobium sp. TaxID=1871063 RepID=UPI00199EF964|nr:hypothetical protein [Aeromicrobium sp.]MBC7630419.1 hypothetical protein [Aeromicrobium sp.]
MRHVLALAATAVLLLPLTLTAGCGSDDATPAPGPRPAPTEPGPSIDATLLDYTNDGDGLTLRTASDVVGLVGAPRDFTMFITAELARQQATKDDACPEKPEIQVDRVDVGGWAAGGVLVPQCGGNAVLWARVDGTWQEVFGGQTLPDCTTLKKYQFPTGVVQGTCADGEKQVPYRAKAASSP